MNKVLHKLTTLVCCLGIFAISGCFMEGGSGTETMGGGKVAGLSSHADGTVAANVAIALRPEAYLEDLSESNRPLFHPTGFTDAKGAYTLDSLRPGNYTLEFRDGKENGAMVRFTVAANKPVLTLGKTVLSPLGVITGSMGEAGKSDPGYVQVYGLAAFGHADSNGQWRIIRVPTGKYRLRVLSSRVDWGYKEVVEVPVQSGETTSVSSLRPVSFQAEEYSNWSHSQSMRVKTQSLNLSDNLANFPLLVRLSKSNFDFTQSSGKDIRFTDTLGRHLPFRISEWDSLGGNAVLWVNLDSILKTHPDLSLKMYWGNKDAAVFQYASLLFGDYTGAWSFSEPVDAVGSAKFFDASPFGAIGYGQILTGNRTGLAGLGCAFNGAEYVSVPVYPALKSKDSLTLSAWIRLKETDILGSEVVTMGVNYGFRVTQNGNIRFFMMTDSSTVSGRAPDTLWRICQTSLVDVRDNLWHHVVSVYDGLAMHVYVDGVLKASMPVMEKLVYPNQGDLKIGTHGGGETGWDFFGNMDEVRISTVARSADWIRLEFENGKPGSQIVGFGL